MKIDWKHPRPGQILILFAIGLLVLIAVAALVLDGAQFLLNRRNAQSAADAGALAGAYNLCAGGGNASTAITTAQNFAMTQNGATAATATVTSGEVNVTATFTQNSFFANIFGIRDLNVSATASAGCYPPGNAQNIMPIAWTCKPPIVGVPTNSSDCSIQTLDYATEMEPLIHGTPSAVTINGVNYSTPMNFHTSKTPQLYIIMDSDPTYVDVSHSCAPYGTVNCGFNLIGSGNRSWLDLNASGNANNLQSWMCGGFTGSIAAHTWLRGQSGVTNSVYQAAANTSNPLCAENNYNLVPVYSQYCTVPDDPKGSTCQTAAHLSLPLAPGQTDTYVPDPLTPNSAIYFHIVGFADFYVTCVDAPSADSHCPGHDAAVAAGLGLPNNAKSIEGYFVRNIPPGIGSGSGGGSGGVNLGVFLRSLTH